MKPRTAPVGIIAPFPDRGPSLNIAQPVIGSPRPSMGAGRSAVRLRMSPPDVSPPPAPQARGYPRPSACPATENTAPRRRALLPAPHIGQMPSRSKARPTPCAPVRRSDTTYATETVARNPAASGWHHHDVSHDRQSRCRHDEHPPHVDRRWPYGHFTGIHGRQPGPMLFAGTIDAWPSRL